MLLRVQCKLARCLPGALVIGLQTNRCTPRGYVSTSYTAAEVDAIAAFAPDLGESFLIPIAEVRSRRSLHLRLRPAGNGQSKGVSWASDYALRPVVERLRRRGAGSAPRTLPATLAAPDP